MTEPLVALAGLRGVWMAGRSAAPLAPADWPGDDEPALVALAGQALQVLTRPAAPTDLAPRPLLPRLARPPMPEPLRPHLRRLLAAHRKQPGAEQGLIQLLAARGYAAHPADWMPKPDDDWAAPVYAPWLAWTEAAPGVASAPVGETLTVDTYAEWPWTERRLALLDLRRREPAAAGQIIAAKAAAEPAERRLKLVEILVERLEPADAPVLEPLAQDRSERVAALARRLLARLGRGAGDPALARELAAMVAVSTRGLIRRRTQLTVPALKTAAQEARRAELFGAVTFAELAAALDVEEAALTASAPAGEPVRLVPFVQCVATTASDQARRTLMEAMLDDDGAPLALTAQLAVRASPDERRSLLGRALAREESPLFASARVFAGDALGVATSSVLGAARAFRQLLEKQGDPAAVTGFFNVGLLVSQDAAATVIYAAVAAGLSIADPRLDTLRFNAALAPSGAAVP
jgi:hypothetical protein